MDDPEVLIAGAGPTGLLLALWLDHLGVRVRIFDRAAEPGTTSRALVVHARTLEFYAQIGLADEVIRRGFAFSAINLWVGGHKRARVAIGDIGKGISPYPYMLVFPQDAHELLLIERLKEKGITVERPIELVTFADEDQTVVAQLKQHSEVVETCRAAFLCGCDGAHSAVRHGLAVSFPGGTNTQVLFVTDIEAHGPTADGEMHGDIGDSNFIGLFPMKGAGRVRVIGVVPPEAAETDPIGFESVAKPIAERLQLRVVKVNWFSSYKVHHRVVEHFRKGRVFLLGDAAHIHSPVGGQGMNTGLGDAVNLAWKLAAVLRTGARNELLDTYESERLAFAKRLIRTTDRAFTTVINPSGVSRFVRVSVIPFVVPRLLRVKAIRQFVFRTVSQTKINYHESALSVGSAGRIRGGDRLPWVRLDDGSDNFAPLQSLKWQVHVYGAASTEVTSACESLNLALHRFEWRSEMARAGLEQDASYVVRPDGYVGFADSGDDARRLEQYFRECGFLS